MREILFYIVLVGLGYMLGLALHKCPEPQEWEKAPACRALHVSNKSQGYLSTAYLVQVAPGDVVHCYNRNMWVRDKKEYLNIVIPKE